MDEELDFDGLEIAEALQHLRAARSCMMYLNFRFPWKAGSAEDKRAKRLFKRYKNSLDSMYETIVSMCPHHAFHNIEDSKYYNGQRDTWRCCRVCNSRIGRICAKSPTGLCEFSKTNSPKKNGHLLKEFGESGISKECLKNGFSAFNCKTCRNKKCDMNQNVPNPKCKHCGRAEDQELEEVWTTKKFMDELYSAKVTKKDKRFIKDFNKALARQRSPYSEDGYTRDTDGPGIDP